MTSAINTRLSSSLYPPVAKAKYKKEPTLTAPAVNAINRSEGFTAA